MAKSIKKFQAKMSPGSRARSEAKARKMIQEMALDEARGARADARTSLKDSRSSTSRGIQAGTSSGHVHQHAERLQQSDGRGARDTCDLSRWRYSNYTVLETKERLV